MTPGAARVGIATLFIGLSSIVGRAGTNATTLAPTAAQLKPLQGSWEGFSAGHEAAGKITVTISGNSLEYQGATAKDRYTSTFTLNTDTYPAQIRSTITEGPSRSDAGHPVYAIYKIVDETLTLVGIEGSGEEPPKSFSDDKPLFNASDGTLQIFGQEGSLPEKARVPEGSGIFRYDLKRRRPASDKTEPSKAK